MTREPVACQVCGVWFKPIRQAKGIACSRDCGFEWQRQQRQTVWTWRSLITYASCACGQLITQGPTRRQQRAACSSACRRRMSGMRERGTEQTGECVECRGSFTYTTRTNTPKLCADCKKKRSRQQRREIKRRRRRLGLEPRSRHRTRAKHYNVEYQPGITLASIYARDKGICHLCGEPVEPTHNGSLNLQGPSLDHVVPLARGGPHTEGNIALAHFLCNSMKSDTASFAVTAGVPQKDNTTPRPHRIAKSHRL